MQPKHHGVSWAFAVPAILCAALLTFAPALFGHFTAWDDIPYLLRNPLLQDCSVASLARSFVSFDPELYLPLTLISHQMMFCLAGEWPVPHHFLNLLLHTSSALLLFALLKRLIKHDAFALVLSLLWLTHPLNAEVVAWVTARKDALMGFFFLATVLCYVRFLQTHNPREYRFSLALHACAVLSKVTAAAFPAVAMLVLAYLHGRVTKRDLRALAPFWMISGVTAGIGLLAKHGVLQNTTFAQKLLLAELNTAFTFVRVLIPWPLSAVHPLPGALPEGWVLWAIGAGAFILTGVLLWRLWYRAQPLAFSLLAALFLLAPTFLHTGKAHRLFLSYDRYAYLPSIGVLLACAYVVQRLRKPKLHSRALCMSMIVVPCFMALSFRQIFVWRNTETLFANVLHTYPWSWLAAEQLSNAALERGDEATAERYLLEGLRWQPLSPELRTNYGALLAKRGDTEGELEQYQAALQADPNYAATHYNLARAYMAAGRVPEAAAQLNWLAVHERALLETLLREEGKANGKID